ncbi:unnamed protein product [Didymodactylos carnosus]|uniref:Uncharacterized protein n=1 Tax=Didymodactylos carnosus TaxID=1234261 RepID=A0A814XL57_9BILA|nr:unnamed protein product [Didymodactylos carnosus]CAF3976757.1 unnamed protein product [Didymodactylos carnosus]
MLRWFGFVRELIVPNGTVNDDRDTGGGVVNETEMRGSHINPIDKVFRIHRMIGVASKYVDRFFVKCTLSHRDSRDEHRPRADHQCGESRRLVAQQTISLQEARPPYLSVGRQSQGFSNGATDSSQIGLESQDVHREYTQAKWQSSDISFRREEDERDIESCLRLAR